MKRVNTIVKKEPFNDWRITDPPAQAVAEQGRFYPV